MQLVICAFPACGKSTITKNAEQYGLKQCFVHYDEHEREYERTVPAGPGTPVYDSDSSVFDKAEFPGNYIKHIKDVLENHPDVVLFISSHEDVRKALHEAGIKYELAYPERELKGEYIERYKERGSPEAFVDMMNEKWNLFIDTCTDDTCADKHIVLSEGEYLVDKIEDRIEDITRDRTNRDSFPTAIINGTESIGDVVTDDIGRPVAVWGHNGLEPIPVETTTDITPQEGVSPEVIVSVQDDAQPNSIPAEVEPEVPAILNTPEETLPAEVIPPVEGQPAVDEPHVEPNPTEPDAVVTTDLGVLHLPDGGTINSVALEDLQRYQSEWVAYKTENPDADVTIIDVTAAIAALTGNEDGSSVTEPAPEPTVTDPTRSELIQATFDIEDDITTLEAVVEICQTEKRDGLEGYEDNGTVFIAAAADIQTRYKVEVEPTLAGFEGFLDTLKEAFNKLTGKVKETEPKKAEALIKKYLFENEKAAGVYTSKEWLESQKLINVGKAKVQVPDFLKEINAPSDVKTALNLVLKRVVDTYEKHVKNTHARTKHGVKIFNALKDKDPSEPISLAAAMLPIKPDYLEDGKKDSGLDELNVKLVTVELPVLNADRIKEVVDIMNLITDTAVKMLRLEESTWDYAIGDDFDKSKYWVKHDHTKEAHAVYDVTSGEEPSFNVIDKLFRDKILNVAQFLEKWILASVK